MDVVNTLRHFPEVLNILTTDLSIDRQVAAQHYGKRNNSITIIAVVEEENEIVSEKKKHLIIEKIGQTL